MPKINPYIDIEQILNGFDEVPVTARSDYPLIGRLDPR